MSDLRPSTAEQSPGVTRRELLNYGWLASLGILSVSVAGASVYFALPRFREGEFGGIIKAGPVSELPTKNEAPVNYPEGKFWLVHTPQGVIALYKVCTHLDCLFNWDEQAGRFVCPCHGSQFERDGTYISGPAPRSLDRFVVQVVSPKGDVLAQTDPQIGNALPVSHNSEEEPDQAEVAPTMTAETPQDAEDDADAAGSAEQETPVLESTPETAAEPAEAAAEGTEPAEADLQAETVLTNSDEITETTPPQPEEEAPAFEDDAIVQVDTGLKIAGRPVV